LRKVEDGTTAMISTPAHDPDLNLDSGLKRKIGGRIMIKSRREN
jgi:hypothetical protein